MFCPMRPTLRRHWPAILVLMAGSAVCLAEKDEAVEGAETQSPPVSAAPEGKPAVVESPEQKRHRELAEQYGAEVADAIQAGTVLKDMTMEQVLMVRGAPDRKEVIPPDAELWHYTTSEVAFSGGKVSYVSLAAKTEPPPSQTPRAVQTPRPKPRERLERTDTVQAPAPEIAVGDSYIYTSIDPNDPSSSVSTRRTVTSTAGRVILSTLNLDNKKARPRSLYFDREWNLIATRSPDGSGLDYSPPLKYFDFPLFPGKTWQQTTTETHIKTGAKRSHTVSAVVGPWEEMTVPAGTFRTIKIELRTNLFDPSTGESIGGTDTSWYAPTVRRSVKSITTGKDGSRRVIQLTWYALADDR